MISSDNKRQRTTGPASVEEEEHTWSSLLGDVLLIIAGKIGSVDDYIRFSCVCRAWRFHAAEYLRKHKLRFGPLYMYGTDPDSKSVTFKNPTSGADFTVGLPETAGSRCWGSPFGWLITFNGTGLRFSLINPVTGATIPLPGLPRDGARVRYRDRMKAFLTADPVSDPDNCLVILVSGFDRLSFVRPVGGKKFWSTIYDGFDLFDVALFKGNLYGIESSYLSSNPYTELFMFQLDHVQDGVAHPHVVYTQTLDLTPHLDENQDPRVRYEKHLVDLNGELCLCVRHNRPVWRTLDVQIFKIDLVTGDLTRVFSLGDYCLFMGNNYSFSCKTAHPMTGLFGQSRRGNYVFYTHYHFCSRSSRIERRGMDDPDPDLEVWDMVQCSKVHSTRGKPPPVYGSLWIVPSIN